MARETERIVVSEDGLSLPVIEVLTGRGVIFGKSGSGKSNSASVIVEELLEKGFPLLIVDIEGEYATLKERYDIVHIGDDEQFDHGLFDVEPGQIVDICLDQNRPVIIDISDVLEIEQAHKAIKDTLRVLFSQEKRAQQPFLVLVEEIHEFLPQQGGLDELGETLIRIAKRGRKRGLGLVGMSQRPASVDKDFITQCDWLVWHRLTWENDTRVVKSILGSDTAREVQELETGEAIMMTDWDETVRRVRFRRKRTADAGDRPSLNPAERRDLTTSAGSGRSGSASGTPVEQEKTDPQGGDRSASAGRDLLVETFPSTMEDATKDDDTVEGEDDDLPSVPGSDPADENETADSPTEAELAPKKASETVPTEKDADPVELQEPEHREPAVATLWELGQLVTFMLAKLLNSFVYGTRVAVSKAVGGNEPVDRLGPVPQHDSRPQPDLSRRTAWIILILLVVVGVLVGFAVVSF